MTETKGRTGRRWARVGALLGGVVSLAANVTHAFILDHGTALTATVSVMSGLLWPTLLMVMTEVIIYNRFRGWGLGYKLLGFPPVAIIAAVSSYLHMSGLLGHAGEGWFISTFGPLAIDGAMVLCSGALMVTRTETAKTETPVPVTPEVIETAIAVPSEVHESAAGTGVSPEPVRRSATVRSMPALDGLPSVPGLTRNRVSQVMAIRAAVPVPADRAALTWGDCGEIVGVTGKGSLQKIHAAMVLMDSLDGEEGSEGGERGSPAAVDLTAQLAQ